MALFFLRANDGSLFYLAPKKEYRVGRKDSDLLITDDSSISRNHATFYIRGCSGNSVVLRDLESKYKTSVNGSEIQPNKDVVLTLGDTIKFGVLNSIYKLDFVKIVTTGSALSKDENKHLTETIHSLNGTVVKNWQHDVEYVTTKTLVMTVKTLCAVVEGKPIVTLKYWDDCLKNVKKNVCLPSTESYLPPWGEETINNNISLEYNALRKTLFKNKVFVFPTKMLKKKMDDIITITGGNSTVWDQNLVHTEQLEGPIDKFIIINDPKKDNSQNVSQSYENILKHLQSIGKRPIPLQEIVLAVLNCSCEKDCNPSFNRINLMLPKLLSEPITHTEKLLVQETQTESLLKEKSAQSLEKVIPASLDNQDVVAFNTISDVITIEDDNAEQINSCKRKDTSLDSTEPAMKKSKSVMLNTTSEKCESELCQKHDESLNSSFNASLKDNPFATQTSKQISESNKISSNSKYVNPFALLLNRNNPSSSTSSKLSHVIDSAETSTATAKRNIDYLKTLTVNTTTTTSTSSSSSSIARNTDPPATSISSTRTNNNHLEKNIDQSETSAIAKRNIDCLSDEIHAPKRVKLNEIMSSTITSKESNKEVTFPELSRIKTEDISVKSEWMSMNSISKNDSNNTTSKTEADEMTSLYQAFKNSVVIKTLPLVVERHLDWSSTNTSNYSGRKNFKKFKKQTILKPQTIVIPAAEYRRVNCS